MDFEDELQWEQQEEAPAIDEGQAGDGADFNELFGGEEEEAAADPDLAPPSPVAPAANAAEERRRAMQELARRQQERGGDGDEEGGAKKKRKRDKGDKGSSKPGKDKEGGGKERRRRLQQRGRGGGEGADAAAAGGGSGGEGGGGADEVAPESEADRAFIDDDGVAEEDRYHDNPEVDAGNEPEAEEGEEDEGGFVAAEGEEEEEDMFGKKRKKKERETDAQLQAAVESMVAKMNIAAELDDDCVRRSRPATHKVKELPAVEAFLRQRKHHEFFILHGGLAAVAKWVHPYDNGTLPTLLVRAKLAELLALLPLDTRNDGLREVLQRSGLGRVVQFHATYEGDAGSQRDEAVKRAYRKLLHAWVQPIVHDPEAEAEKRARQAAHNERQRRLALARAKADAEALAKRREAEAQIAPGSKGFRRHAYIPTAAKLDYTHNPGRGEAGSGGGGARGGRRRGDDDDENDDGGFGAMAAVAPEPGRGRGGGGGGGPELSPLARKMREVQRARKGSAARAAKVSVEGRNISMM